MTGEADPGLPIKLGPCSNGEFEPELLSSAVMDHARLFGADPVTVPCEFSRDEMAEALQASTLDNRTFGPTTPAGARAVFARRFG